MMLLCDTLVDHVVQIEFFTSFVGKYSPESETGLIVNCSQKNVLYIFVDYIQLSLNRELLACLLI